MSDGGDVAPGEGADPAALTRTERRTELLAQRQQLRRHSAARGLFVGSLLVAVAMVVLLVLLHPWARDGARRAGAGPTVSRAPVDPGPALFHDPDTAGAVLAATRAGVAAVDSYDFSQLDQSIAAGVTASTGEFLANYRAAMTGDLGTAALTAKVVQTCTVQAVGLRWFDADGTQADLLVFGTVSLTQAQGTTRSAPQRTPVSLQVTMTRVGADWLISSMVDVSRTQLPAFAAPGGPALAQATDLGLQDVANLLSYRRSAFDSDFQRALDGMTAELAKQQQANRAAIQHSMTDGGFDLVGTVGAAAISAAGYDSVTMIVLLHSTRVDDQGTATPISDPRYQLTLVRTGGQWLVSQFTALDQG